MVGHRAKTLTIATIIMWAAIATTAGAALESVIHARWMEPFP
jgi:hypothetical protein